MVRLKTRYLLFDLIYPDTITSEYDGIRPELNTVNIHTPSKTSVDIRLLNRVFRDAIRDAYGEYGAGSVASTIAVKYFSPTTSTGILRVSRQHYQLTWAGLTLIQSIDGREVIIQVVHVSGTIKKCEQAAIARNKAMVDKIHK
ncbi:ribonucleases P/MRP protein subunit POP5, partial [Nadsonia fulvescens var. elongata DSM 6958]